MHLRRTQKEAVSRSYWEDHQLYIEGFFLNGEVCLMLSEQVMSQNVRLVENVKHQLSSNLELTIIVQGDFRGPYLDELAV